MDEFVISTRSSLLGTDVDHVLYQNCGLAKAFLVFLGEIFLNKKKQTAENDLEKESCFAAIFGTGLLNPGP